MADSEVHKLIIWVGTQAKINQAREQGLIGYDDFTCVTGLPEFALQSEVQAIQVLIPSAATAQNQLADKDFVNSSINNMAAFYVTSDVQGNPFDTRTDLLAGPWYNQGVERTPTQNDYALVTEDETHDDLTSRYMYDGTQWVWQYTLNNTKFTQAQIDAINSGITAALVSQITTNQNNIGDLNSLTTTAKTSLVAAVNELQSGKQTTLVSGTNIKTVNNNSLLGSGNIDIDALPSQSGQSGKFLSTNGTVASWESISVPVTDVQVNGTSILSGGVANIPPAGGNASSLGVIYASGGYGLTTNTSTGLIRTVCATEAQVIAKTNTYNPITPSVLDISIREGLGNNELTWTEAYKTSARNTIGAGAKTIIREWIG